ncbi:MAG: 5-methyltetrahydropteroyltriglutamate--homocysteine methyltransferase [Gemmataceae bacterium]|nr:5-methyltetrahydropteroyltriglutamate--homocysteine methyltransferase [Gemmataceae bacterium]
MQPRESHPHASHASFEGGDLDCGNGLLLLIRKHLDPLEPGQLLEIRSRESSVDEDLPAWARLTGNELVSFVKHGNERSFLVSKGKFGGAQVQTAQAAQAPPHSAIRTEAPSPAPAMLQPLPRFAVMGVGSWPRPRWMLQAVHEYLEGRLSEDAFQHTADDAVRLAAAAQERAGVDVVTDGEQRRDTYAGFVGSRLDNCQLVPLTDLLPYVDDPQHFAEELRSLDVPADSVRHPAVFGRLKRTRPLAVHEARFLRGISRMPTKIALPGPYLLTRTMWLECVSERVYHQREDLAADLIYILREEIAELLAEGVALIQLDEPILTEVVYARSARKRSFMCGALGEKLDTERELAFAADLMRQVCEGFPRHRLAMHVCRGNWSRDESVALQGDYRPLLSLLKAAPVGTLFLELCTPRAGEMDVLRDIPSDIRIGVGVSNPKSDAAEAEESIIAAAEHAVAAFGPDRVFLNPDCGFATFADNPVASAAVAEAKSAAIARAAQRLREKYGTR